MAYNQFLATLRLSGFTVVDAGGLLKVVPEADAKLQGGAVSVGPPVAGNQIVTQIFRLNYEPAANLVPILRPLISPNNTINVNPGNNSLVITDYADNLQRLGAHHRRARRFQCDRRGSHSAALRAGPRHGAGGPAPGRNRRRRRRGPGPQGQVDSSFRTTVIAETRSNTLLVRAANPARLNLVRTLVRKARPARARKAPPATSTWSI